eukprot:TRINITY_DN47984_c0_g1_i1.p1 TRINITY_DN47984_c0_g1~~TRINITY_DN47984_c0_g1_i1.p1  ORF type:complete len:304 (+),score=100.71 TRINITY_DN47984_c0_g1_i1:74-985(+)
MPPRGLAAALDVDELSTDDEVAVPAGPRREGQDGIRAPVGAVPFALPPRRPSPDAEQQQPAEEGAAGGSQGAPPSPKRPRPDRPAPAPEDDSPATQAEPPATPPRQAEAQVEPPTPPTQPTAEQEAPPEAQGGEQQGAEAHPESPEVEPDQAVPRCKMFIGQLLAAADRLRPDEFSDYTVELFEAADSAAQIRRIYPVLEGTTVKIHAVWLQARVTHCSPAEGAVTVTDGTGTILVDTRDHAGTAVEEGDMFCISGFVTRRHGQAAVWPEAFAKINSAPWFDRLWSAEVLDAQARLYLSAQED